jgi:fumarylacetoacetate (FAA) hydrolase family protein
MAFSPRGWRLVRIGAGPDVRLGAVDPAAPSVVRALRERDPLEALRRGLARCAAEATDEHAVEDPATLAPLRLLAPLEPQEIWAAGVTYERSRHARVEESESSADVYALVYDAERPELFLKDAGCRRTVGPNEAVAVRSESRWTVPEPELGLVLDADGSIMAVTAGNDLTARDIEAENPLYLPQAKLFAGCCALGPAVLVPDDPAAPYAISVRIWNAEGALVNEDGLLVRPGEPAARGLGAAHRDWRRPARRRRPRAGLSRRGRSRGHRSALEPRARRVERRRWRFALRCPGSAPATPRP